MANRNDQPFPWRFVLIVGASSGIGAELARRLGESGATVALVARRRERLELLKEQIDRQAGENRAAVYVHDVHRTEDVPELFQRIAADLGGLDLVIYSSGIMPPPGPREYPTAIDVETIEVNFSGAVAWLNEAAARFDRLGQGTIIGISSVAGDRGRTGFPIYNATKAALNSYLESLRARLARRGVRVLTAKPGYVRTELIEGRELPAFVPVISAERAASEILRAAAAGKRVVYVPAWLRPVMFAVRMIPRPIFERISL